jgi:hypothetical protein
VAFFGFFEQDVNREFRLKKSVAGSISDISPVVSARPYGVNAYGFRIRAYDSNRDYMIVCGTGNDTSNDDADDYQAVFVSSDGGANWSNIVTPVNSTETFAAAFAGDTQNVLYVWGPAEYMIYSNNFGVDIDDRSGNLSTFTPGGFLGIMGGPTG